MKIQKVKGFRLNKHYFKLYLFEILIMLTVDLGCYISLITLAYDKNFGLFFKNKRQKSYGIEFNFVDRNTVNEKMYISVYEYNNIQNNKTKVINKLFPIK
jgi:hypothetical protein